VKAKGNAKKKVSPPGITVLRPRQRRGSPDHRNSAIWGEKKSLKETQTRGVSAPTHTQSTKTKRKKKDSPKPLAIKPGGDKGNEKLHKYGRKARFPSKRAFNLPGPTM